MAAGYITACASAVGSAACAATGARCFRSDSRETLRPRTASLSRQARALASPGPARGRTSSCICRAEQKEAIRTSGDQDESTRAAMAELLKTSISKAGGAIGAMLLSASMVLGSPEAADAVTESQLIFLEAWRAVDRAYVDKTFNGNPWFRLRETTLKKADMSTRAATYQTIRDTLKLLDDPFTRFLDPEQYAALASGTKGSVTGVGLEVGFDANLGADSSLVVVAPASGGPAEEAGIQPKDIVLAIDGVETKGLTLYQAAEKLQGEEGSEVQLKVENFKGGKERLVSLIRRKIRINPVSYALCSPASASLGGNSEGGKVGYVRLATFNKNTADATREALLDLKNSGAERYVLDIRNNGGGLFPAGVQVAKMFINAGDIVLIADSQGIRDTYSADFSAVVDKQPLSVLVNRGTASAAEVLTGALQDNNRAVVVGEQTFGKGIIQTIVPLSDGSAVAVTVAAYQTPNEISINKVGITPDLELPEEVPTTPEAFCGLITSERAPRLYK